MYTVLLVIHTLLVLFLIGIILLQRSSSDGLGGLGGGGGNQFLTGRGQANLMTRTTAFLAAAFFATSLILAIIANRMTGGSILDAAPAEISAPAVPEAAPKAAEKAPASAPAPVVPKPE